MATATPPKRRFAKADRVVRVKLHAQRISGAPMEPKSALAAFDPQTGRFDIYMPTQGMSDIMKEFAHVTGLTPEQFRIHAKDVGGGFGVRNEVYPEFAALAFAARSLGRPVKWTGTRAELLLSDHHGRGVTLSGELALDPDGHFLGMRIEWLVDVGAYSSNAGPFTNTAAAPTSMAANAYRTPALYGLNRLMFTNATPTAPYRGAGRPSVSYLAERLVDEAARITGIDRIELRRRNILTKDAFPYKTPTGSTYDSGDPAALLDEVLRAADWNGFERRRAEAKARGKLRGIGCATFIEPSGGLGQEEIAIKFDANGLPQLFTLAGPSGQGHETVFPDLVAGILGMSADKITLRASDPDGPPLVGTGSFGSRSLISHGGALSVGAHEVVRKGLALAAKDLEVAATDIVFEQGRYRVPGHRSVDQPGGSRAQTCRRRKPSARCGGQDRHCRRIPKRRACRRGRDRSRNRCDRTPSLCGGGRLREHLQSHPGRRPTPGRDHAGTWPDLRRALHVRPRKRAIPHRHVHGLLHAARRHLA